MAAGTVRQAFGAEQLNDLIHGDEFRERTQLIADYAERTFLEGAFAVYASGGGNAFSDVELAPETLQRTAEIDASVGVGAIIYDAGGLVRDDILMLMHTHPRRPYVRKYDMPSPEDLDILALIEQRSTGHIFGVLGLGVQAVQNSVLTLCRATPAFDVHSNPGARLVRDSRRLGARFNGYDSIPAMGINMEGLPYDPAARYLNGVRSTHHRIIERLFAQSR